VVRPSSALLRQQLTRKRTGGTAAFGLLGRNQRQLNRGTNIMVGGIVVQLVAMVVFSLLGIEFWISAKRHEGFEGKRRAMGGKLDLFVGSLAFGAASILLRCAPCSLYVSRISRLTFRPQMRVSNNRARAGMDRIPHHAPNLLPAPRFRSDATRHTRFHHWTSLLLYFSLVEDHGGRRGGRTFGELGEIR
jgi:hypothetical protein